MVSVPRAIRKHSLTKAYMLYLAHWARKLSWKETALSFGTTWDQVCHAVEYVVQWGLEHRELGTLRAIGVDEIHIGQSHKFLTLVYQIEADCVRLLWVGKDRTMNSFEKFFNIIKRPHAWLRRRCPQWVTRDPSQPGVWVGQRRRARGRRLGARSAGGSASSHCSGVGVGACSGLKPSAARSASQVCIMVPMATSMKRSPSSSE